MARVKAATLQNILNVIPMPGYNKAFRLDESLIAGFGGLQPYSKGNITFGTHYGGNDSPASFAEDDSYPTAGSQSKRLVDQAWKRYWIRFGADGLQESVVAHGGVHDINDILTTEGMEAVDDLLHDINTDLMGDGTGNSAKNIYGIKYHIADDNTWNSFARGSYAYYQSYVNDNSGTDRSLTEALLRTMHTTMKDTRKSNYDEIWCSNATKYIYEDLIGDKKRYVNVTRGDVVIPKLAFEGRPIVPMDGYSENRMDFIRKRDWKLAFLPQVSRDVYGRQIQGPFKVQEVAQTSDDTDYVVAVYANLICVNPWKQGVLDDVE